MKFLKWLLVTAIQWVVGMMFIAFVCVTVALIAHGCIILFEMFDLGFWAFVLTIISPMAVHYGNIMLLRARFTEWGFGLVVRWRLFRRRIAIWYRNHFTR